MNYYRNSRYPNQEFYRSDNPKIEKVAKFLEDFATLRRRLAYFVYNLTKNKIFKRKQIYMEIFEQAEYYYSVRPELKVMSLDMIPYY